MKYVRTVAWMILTAFVAIFLAMNWGDPVDVRIWPSTDGNNFLFEWPVGIVALVFFLLGLIPTWLYHRGMRWRLERRISALETAARSNALSRHEPPATTTDKIGPTEA